MSNSSSSPSNNTKDGCCIVILHDQDVKFNWIDFYTLQASALLGVKKINHENHIHISDQCTSLSHNCKSTLADHQKYPLLYRIKNNGRQSNIFFTFVQTCFSACKYRCVTIYIKKYIENTEILLLLWSSLSNNALACQLLQQHHSCSNKNDK